jgi:hypothetical protein
MIYLAAIMKEILLLVSSSLLWTNLAYATPSALDSPITCTKRCVKNSSFGKSKELKKNSLPAAPPSARNSWMAVPHAIYVIFATGSFIHIRHIRMSIHLTYLVYLLKIGEIILPNIF